MDKLAVNMLTDAIGDKPIRSISEAELKRFKALRQAAPRNLSPYFVNSQWRTRRSTAWRCSHWRPNAACLSAFSWSGSALMASG